MNSGGDTMNTDLGKRADHIIERYNAKRTEYRKTHPPSREAAAHDLYLAEVPNLSAKIDRAISEFNDRASDTSLRVAVRVDGAPHFSLTIFKIGAVAIFDPKLELSLTVDYDGNVIGFISGKGDTDRLAKIGIVDLTEPQIFEMILELVDRELDVHQF
jgi:hypothetical protein